MLHQVWKGLSGHKNRQIGLRQSDQLSVHFKGERSVDVGGPYREVLTQIVSDMKNDRILIPMLKSRKILGNSRVLIPNPNVPELSIHNFVGQIIGIAPGQIIIVLNLPPLIWKMIVDQRINRRDICGLNLAVSETMKTSR